MIVQAISFRAKTLSAFAAFGMLTALCAPFTYAQNNQSHSWNVDPTYLHRNITTATEEPSDITTSTCHYKPLIGVGDTQIRLRPLTAPSWAASPGMARQSSIPTAPVHPRNIRRRIRFTSSSTGAGP